MQIKLNVTKESIILLPVLDSLKWISQILPHLYRGNLNFILKSAWWQMEILREDFHKGVKNRIKLLLGCIMSSISNGATILEITPRYSSSHFSAVIFIASAYTPRKKVAGTCRCYYNKTVKAVHTVGFVNNDYLILVFQQSSTTWVQDYTALRMHKQTSQKRLLVLNRIKLWTAAALKIPLNCWLTVLENQSSFGLAHQS